MSRKYLASLTRERPGGHVVAHVRGFNDTHVIVDVEHIGKKGRELVPNQNRPIARFMEDYGL